MSKKILIIGSGIAGLSSGCYAQMNGFSSEIFEMQAHAGGLCTAWKRKDYIFDGCVHWLTGSSPDSNYYPFWVEIGLIQDKKFYHYENAYHYITESGRNVVIHVDPDELEKEMLAIAPEDKKRIHALITDIRKLQKYEIPVEFGLKALNGLFTVLSFFYRYRMNNKEYASRFKNPELRSIMQHVMNWHEMSVSFPIWSIATMGSGKGGYPYGGSAGLIRSVEERYRKLGGTIRFNSRVKKILTETNKAVGILLEDGTEHRGDFIISAADGHSTIFDWLDGKYVNKKLRRIYDTFRPFPPLVYVSMGIDADLSHEPHAISYPLKNPVRIGKEEKKRIEIRNYAFDPALCPKGKSIIIFMTTTEWEYWEPMKNDPERYLAEKKLIEEASLSALSERYPDIRPKVEVIDIATPLTYNRYTGNWKGSYEGWLFNKKSALTRIPVTLPGLTNFYMTGHWVSPGGGLPSGLLTARGVLKKICKSEKISFKTIRNID